jgi:hypothetical protein
MSDFKQCPKCKEWSWRNPCPCVVYEVAIPWKGEVDVDDWYAVHAEDPELAIEKFAQHYDSDGDYSILRNNGADEVWCRLLGDTVISKWRIVAESEPQYYAKPIP